MKLSLFRIVYLLIIVVTLTFVFGHTSWADQKKKILFHSFVGSENPTRACLPFLQALANKERGDEVYIALAGDAVVLLRDSVINSVVPIGWPPLKETFQKVVQHDIPIYV